MAEVLEHSTGQSGGRPGGVIIAKGSRDYRWRRYVLALIMFGWGLWSLRDGYIRYPNQNEEDRRLHPGVEIVSHTDLDIKLNKIFGMALPPLSLLFLGWVLYQSRGYYGFDGTTISTPGHPNVPITSIRKIDRDKWDRKGIAYLHYQIPGSATLGIITLDDFIYDRKPTDLIFDAVAIAVEANKAVAVTVPAASQG